MPGDRSAKIEHRVFFLFVACFSIYFPDSLTDDFCFCFLRIHLSIKLLRPPLFFFISNEKSKSVHNSGLAVVDGLCYNRKIWYYTLFDSCSSCFYGYILMIKHFGRSL